MLRKYGVETDLYFPLIEAGTSDYLGYLTLASGDAKVLEGSSWVNADNTPTMAEPSSGVYKLTLSAAEMSRAAVIVKVVDQSTPKVFEDQLVEIETYGHASAQHAFDLDSARVDVGEWLGQAVTVSGNNKPDVNIDEIADDNAGDTKLLKAIKMLINKAVQTKSTGVIEYYDDDGESVILTHTPTDAEADITRTPS